MLGLNVGLLLKVQALALSRDHLIFPKKSFQPDLNLNPPCIPPNKYECRTGMTSYKLTRFCFHAHSCSMHTLFGSFIDEYCWQGCWGSSSPTPCSLQATITASLTCSYPVTRDHGMRQTFLGLNSSSGEEISSLFLAEILALPLGATEGVSTESLLCVTALQTLEVAVLASL